jgi:hypothetical protein
MPDELRHLYQQEIEEIEEQLSCYDGFYCQKCEKPVLSCECEEVLDEDNME